MRFYNRQHRHYCGIDLHVKTMYVCILDAAGQVLLFFHGPLAEDPVSDTPPQATDDARHRRRGLAVVTEPRLWRKR